MKDKQTEKDKAASAIQAIEQAADTYETAKIMEKAAIENYEVTMAELMKNVPKEHIKDVQKAQLQMSRILADAKKAKINQNAINRLTKQFSSKKYKK